MILTMDRFVSGDDGTGSVVAYGATNILRFLELPWRQNEVGISHVPDGEYECTYMARSHSGKFRDVYYLQEVPKREGILIHLGNLAGDRYLGYATDSAGCLLPCLNLAEVRLPTPTAGDTSNTPSARSQLCGLHSRAAMRRLHDLVNRSSFTLKIRSHYNA